MLIFVEIELLHFSELQNGSKVINLQPLISESIMEGPRPQGLPAPWFLSPACPNRADAERKQQKAIQEALKKQRAAAARLQKQKETGKGPEEGRGATGVAISLGHSF